MRYSRLASARTTWRPRKPDPPNTVTSVSRFDAMRSIPAVKFERSWAYFADSRYANTPFLYSIFAHRPGKVGSGFSKGRWAKNKQRSPQFANLTSARPVL